MRQVHLIALLVSLVFAFPVSELWRWLQTADQVGELWSSRQNSGYRSESGIIHGPGYEVIDYHYEGMWDVEAEPDDLVHIVFFPHCVEYKIGSTASLGSWGTSDILSLPEGLYLDGVPARLGPERRVFIYTAKRRMRPVPLTAEELKALTPDAMDRLPETEVWRKIEAVLDEEKWCCGCPVPPAPVQAPKPDQD